MASLTLFMLSDSAEDDPDGSITVTTPATAKTFRSSLALDAGLRRAFEVGCFNTHVKIRSSTDGWLYELLMMLGNLHPACQRAQLIPEEKHACRYGHSIIAERISAP
jgi:hypothetical protein